MSVTDADPAWADPCAFKNDRIMTLIRKIPNNFFIWELPKND
jgi:hypothetical protein